MVSTAGVYGPDVRWVLHDASGAFRSTGTTTSGWASLPYEDGGMVTVLMGKSGEARLMTYVGLKQGDQLQVAAAFSREVVIPIEALPMGAAAAQVAVGASACSTIATGTSALVSFTSECLQEGVPFFPQEPSVLAFSALEAAQATPHAFFSMKTGILLADAGTTTVTGLSSWTEGQDCTVEVINAPTDAAGVPSLALLLFPGEFDISWYSPPPFAYVSYGGPYVLGRKVISLSSGSASATFDWLNGLRSGAELEYRSVTPDGFIQRTAMETGFSTPAFARCATATVDLSGLLPALTSVSQDGATPRPLISWTSEAPLTSASGGVVRLSWSGASGTKSSWTFIVPPDSQSVQAPELPLELAAWGPTYRDTLDDPSVSFFRPQWPRGGSKGLAPLTYDETRSWAAISGLTRDPALGASMLWQGEGPMSMTSLTPPSP